MQTSSTARGDTAPAPVKATSWVDFQGRTWIPRLTLEMAGDLKADGLDLFDANQLSGVYQHPIEFLRLAAFCHRSQSVERGLTDVQMMDLLIETEAIADQAKAAVEAALVDFFRRVPGGKPLAVVLERAAEATTRTERAQVAALTGSRGDQAIAATVGRALAPLNEALGRLSESGNPSGPTPAS
jgi:hypothetical protein